jgi:hypothetical protein
VTNAGLASLAGAPNLEELVLSGFTAITDDGVGCLLSSAPRLSRLRLAACGGTTAEGVAAAGAAAGEARGARVTVEWTRR